MTRTRTLVAAVALVAAAAAGCSNDKDQPNVGGSAAPIGGSPTTAAQPTTAAPTGTLSPTALPSAPSSPESTPTSTRCHTSELSATFAGGDAATGNRYADLVLRNRSGHSCTIYGYGGLQPLDSAHKQLPVTLTRDASQGGPKLVRLAPGASVARTIHWTVVPSGTQATCPKGSFAEIIPPDETSPLVVAYQFGDICGSAIDGTPFGVTR